MRHYNRSLTGDHLPVMRMDMRDFAIWLSRQTGRTVVDGTGLTGRYDIRLDLNRNELYGTSSPGGSGANSRDAAERS